MLRHRTPDSPATRTRTRADALRPPMPRKSNGMPGRSLIDASATIVGDLRSDDDIELDGRVCGSIVCHQLIVGNGAVVTGAITAGQVVVRGRITGTIRASVVILQDTARVESEITYALLAVDEGATFEGVARHRLDPLQDKDRPSALADLHRMLTSPQAGKGPCAPKADRVRHESEQPCPVSTPVMESSGHAAPELRLDDLASG